MKRTQINALVLRSVLNFLVFVVVVFGSQSGGLQAATGSASSSGATQAGSDIDFNRVRELVKKKQQGGALTADEQAYVNKAIQAKKKMDAQGAGANKELAANLPKPSPTTGLVPLTDMGEAKYKGEDGGLYGGGSNEPPPAHQAAARKALKEIQPLDEQGRPSKQGKIVLISIGFSNVTMEFSRFKEMADQEPGKNPRLVIVDGAQGAQDAIIWADTENQLKHPTRHTSAPVRDVWAVLEQRLKEAGVTAAQVQVCWTKQARGEPMTLGEFPAHARELQANQEKIVMRLKRTYPNLRLVFFSSRTYGGYANVPTNPEPYAYEAGFAVRWLVQDQIKGKPELNCDPARGTVKAPVLLWGPYLWTDGMQGRQDGLVWRLEDTVYKKMEIPLPNRTLTMFKDGTHPSLDGIKKVDDLLMAFFKTSPYAQPWFLSGAP